MSAHVPDDLLASFVDGVMDEALAIHVAEHLDACPMCASRAACLEPLAGVLARVEDPPVPVGLAASILAAAEAQLDAPHDLPRAVEPAGEPVAARVVDGSREIAIGGGMLTAAAALLALVGDPVALAAHGAIVMGAASSLGRALLLGVSPAVVLPLTIFVGASGTVVLVRTAWPDALPTRDAA